jgi:electron transport complex protein RnfG
VRELGRAITRSGLLLAGFAALTALLVAGTYLGTRDRISAAERAAQEKALLEIMPRSLHDNSMLDDRLELPVNDPLLQLPEARDLYVARKDGVAAAALVPALAPDGYSGAIELLVGVWRDGSIAGVRVIRHRETPGLGDAIDHRKSDWVEDFRGRSLDNPEPERWTVRRDGGAFDQFTGATITPRAVVKATARVLQYVEAHHEEIFGSADEIARRQSPPAAPSPNSSAALAASGGAGHHLEQGMEP